MTITSISRDTNNNVSLVRMITTDNLATVASAGYITTQMPTINALNSGPWGWYITDMILVSASNGNGFFFFTDSTFSSLIAYGEQGSGKVNPGLANQLAYYPANGSTISGLATANNGTLITSSAGVPSISSTLPSAVQGNITSLGTITSGVWAGTTVAILHGGTGVTSVTTAPTATAFAGWDTNKNLSANNVIKGYTTTATAASTTALLVGSTYLQFFTGTTTQTVTMPVVTGLVLGQQYFIVNNSTGVVTVEASGGGADVIQAMASGSTLLLTCIALTGVTAASWSAQYTVDVDISGAVLLSPSGNQTITAYNLTVAAGNITAGSSGNAGTLISFPATATEGSLILAAVSNSAGNYTTTISNASSVGQSQVISIPDSDSAAASFILSSALAGQTIATSLSVTNALSGTTVTATQGTLVSGASGTAGTITSFPATASKGTLVLAAVANTGNTATTISNAAMGQATVVSIPDPGTSTATFAVNTGSLTSGHLVSYNGTAGLVQDSGVTAASISKVVNWTAASSTPITAAINTGYYITDASQVTITLPATAAAGSIVAIVGNGAGGWILQPGSGQTIKLLNGSASTSITSAEQYDCIEVLCVVANTTWVTRSFVSTGFTVS